MLPLSLQPKFRSALSVGFLIGTSFLMVNVMLLVAAVSGGNMAAFGMGDAKSATQAVTAFASLLLIALIFFTTFLTLYRDTLLPPPPMSAADNQAPLPPPQFSAAGGSATAAYGGYTAGGYGGDESGGYGDKSYTTESVPAVGGISGSGSSVL